MVRASYIAHNLSFKRPAGTSRGVLHQKACWYLVLTGEDGVKGLGEVSFIPGLSVEDPHEIEIQIDHVCKLISRGELDPTGKLPNLPGVSFALETAWLDLNRGGTRLLFPSDFTSGLEGIPTNGLIWMGDPRQMKKQIRDKLEVGFRVLKMKVGALELNSELEILRGIRAEYGVDELEIRLDANGAWSFEQAPGFLQKFAEFGIHSIEQPIAPGQTGEMAELCVSGPIPIALDEELIGISSTQKRASLLDRIKPAYVILKPGLIGGFSLAKEWIDLAKKLDVGWWITSALESSVGLSAIAQWTHCLNVTMPQGLGLGTLYTNNLSSPLEMERDRLWYRPQKKWDLQLIPGI
ncbi:MAG: o-succinylbenzoate synthase [Bacteroidetes bacterium]|jgi:o-succinylbenzoate synthase|nr:MAG: o-succinylbenzoate synthase [Bacteroidota bacterium]